MGNLSTKIIAVITAFLIFISLYLIFGYARIEGTMLEVQKIFYYHVSAALTLYLAFGINCIFSVKYLIQRKPNDDLLASAAAELGLIFCTIVLLSGPIWARYAWNTWWNWEPRLTSTLILWLMYIGYFILRSALEDDKRRLYSAVLGVIAFVDVPIVHFATKFWKSEAHPKRGAKFDIDPSMLYTFLVVLIACILLFTLLLIVRYRVKKTQARYEIMRQKHLGEVS